MKVFILSNYKRILLVVLILCLISCGKSNRQIEEEREASLKQKSEQIKINNENAIKSFSQKYNAVLDWDTLECFTYNY